MSAKKKDVEYVAVRELRYPSTATGRELHIHPGRVVHDMDESSLKHEIAAGNVVPKDQYETAKEE